MPYSISPTPDEYGWCEGKIQLPVWADFQCGDRLVRPKSSAGESVEISIKTNDSIRPTQSQLRAIENLDTNQASIQNDILKSLLKVYPGFKNDLRFAYSQEELNEFMPDINKTEHFKKLIYLSRIHIFKLELAGTAYAGFEFECTWDEEHGLGVMTHIDRIVSWGHADNAFQHHAASDDLKKLS